MPEAYPQPFAGQRATAALLRSMLPQTLRKTADTPRAATTTQTADPHLQMTVAAGAVYTWWGRIKYDAVLAGDIVVGFSSPSGSLGDWTGFGTGTTVVSGTGANATQQDQVSTWGYTLRAESTDIANTRTYGGLNVGNTLTIQVSGDLRVGPTGGTFAMAWSQSVSNATATTVYTDSWLMVQRIA